MGIPRADRRRRDARRGVCRMGHPHGAAPRATCAVRRDRGDRAGAGSGVRPAHALARFALALLLAPAAAQPAVVRTEQLDAMRLPVLAERIAKLHAQAGLGGLAGESRGPPPPALPSFRPPMGPPPGA